MKKLLTLILVLCSVVGFAQMRGGSQYDPGAARANLSNVDATATPSMTSITLSGRVKAAWADILGGIYASGTVKVSTGTAAAPAYSFASDPNTGVYSPAADTVGVSVAGAEALRVNSAGEVLVATSTDAGDYKLQVNGNVYVAGLTMPDDKNTHRLVIGRFSAALPYAYLVAGETDKDAAVGFQFRARNAAGAEIATMIIDGAGNSVLVATSTPDLSSRLQVGGAIRLTGVSTIVNPFAGQIYFDSDDGHFYGYSGTAWIQLDN